MERKGTVLVVDDDEGARGLFSSVTGSLGYRTHGVPSAPDMLVVLDGDQRMVWSVVVDKHKGSIRFDTGLDNGTTFIIRLPIVDGAT